MNRRPASPKKPTAPVIRCAIYTRKSSEEGLNQEFNSLDAQRQGAEAYIASQKAEGWVCLAARYDDGGYTGGNLERPALQRLMADIGAGKVDCVVVYKVDRLSRSLIDFARIVEVFERHNVSFVSVTQHFNTTHSMGRLTLNILLSFAQFEREIIGERIRDKIAASRQRGQWTGGTPILGYDVDRSGPSPKLVINPIEAARVVAIYHLYVELGALLPVVAELNRRGWGCKAWTTRDGRERGGQPFDKGRLSFLLKNPLYIGKVRYKNELHPGAHEAIVPAELFEQVQGLLRRRAASSESARVRHGSLLQGLIGCTSCGGMMSHTFTTCGNRRYRYYQCTRKSKRGSAACSAPSLPAVEIERVIVDEIRVIARDRKLIRATLRAAKSQQSDAIVRLEREARLLRRATDESGPNPDPRLAEITSELLRLRADTLDEKRVAAALADFDRLWDHLIPRDRSELIHQLVARVDFDGADNSIGITFHNTGLRTLNGKAADSEEAA